MPPPQAARRTEREASARQPSQREDARKRFDIETLVGGSWFNWIGIVAITFGVAFFLKYAFENQWIGPAGRVTLGAAAGMGMLIAGERLRRARGMAQFAYILSGGGILILYLSVYAAFALYHLIGQVLAFLLMVAVTTTAVLLSARYNAFPVAILGLLGGFLTPVLLSTGVDNEAALFGYVALLDAGVLALAYYKGWRSLNYISFVLTLLMIVGWMETYYLPPKLWLTIFFLSLFFLLFSLLAIVHNVLKERAARWLDISLIITNATFYFGMSYRLLDEANYDALLGSFALIVSSLYVLLFYVTYRRHRADRLLTYSYLGAGITFFTMAIAIQLDQQWVTIGWAVEGLVLTWVGLRSDTSAPRHVALIVFAIAITHWIGADMRDFAFDAGSAFVPLLNKRAASCAVLVACLAATAWLYNRAGEKIEAGERSSIIAWLILAANALVLTLLSLDVNDYFEQRMMRAGVASEASDVLARLENTRQFSLSVMWTIYGATALVFGVVRNWKPLRMAALLLVSVTILKVIALDLSYYDAAWHVLLFNQTFVTLALLAAALGVVARAYWRATHIAAEERSAVIPLAIAIANLLALTALSAEAMGYFDRAQAALVGAQSGAWSEVARLENNKQFALTVIWTLYGTAAVFVGVMRRIKPLRIAALLLLGVTIVKLFLLDVTYSAAAWHAPVFNQTFATFALLVAALAVIVRLYARAGERVDEEERASVIPCLIVVANALAITGLSAEASGYFAKRINAGGDGLRDLRLAQQLSLSVIWATYGGALLVVGLIRQSRLLRVMALLLLSATTLKVFFWDLASLDKIYRIVSFIVLGAILLAVSYLYQKSQRTESVERGG